MNTIVHVASLFFLGVKSMHLGKWALIMFYNSFNVSAYISWMFPVTIKLTVNIRAITRRLTRWTLLLSSNMWPLLLKETLWSWINNISCWSTLLVSAAFSRTQENETNFINEAPVESRHEQRVMAFSTTGKIVQTDTESGSRKEMGFKQGHRVYSALYLLLPGWVLVLERKPREKLIKHLKPKMNYR